MIISAILAVLWLACCALARRYQGAAKETVPLKRMPWRMVLFWVPATGLGVALAWFAGVPWWVWPATAIPGLWSWMPGAYNSFAVWGLMGRKTTYKFAEALQGAIGGALAVLISVVATWVV